MFYTRAFKVDDVKSGVLFLNTGLNCNYPVVTIVDHENTRIFPDNITLTSTDSVIIDFTSLTGFMDDNTWNILCSNGNTEISQNRNRPTAVVSSTSDERTVYPYDDNPLYDIAEVSHYFSQSFDDSNLVDGVITLDHSLDSQFPVINVWDNNNQFTIPTEITIIDNDTVSLDFSSMGTLSGEWNVSMIGGDGSTYFVSNAFIKDTFRVQHNLGQRNVHVYMYDGDNEMMFPDDVSAINGNEVEIYASSYSARENELITVCVIGGRVSFPDNDAVMSNNSPLNFHIQDKVALADWILSKFGAPSINVELASNHLDNAIHEALEKFAEFCIQEENYYVIDTADYIPGRGILLPNTIQSIFSYSENITHMDNSSNIFSPRQQMIQNNTLGRRSGLGGGNAGNWITYELAEGYLEMTDRLMGGNVFSFDYNSNNNRLLLHPEPATIGAEGNAILGVRTIRTTDQLYGESFVKRYAFELCKEILFAIRSKFQMTLPGGGTINLEHLQDYRDKQEQLLEELYMQFPSGVHFFIG